VFLGIKRLLSLNFGLVHQELKNRLSGTGCTPCGLANMLHLGRHSWGDHLSSRHFFKGDEKRMLVKLTLLGLSTIDEKLVRCYIKVIHNVQQEAHDHSRMTPNPGLGILLEERTSCQMKHPREVSWRIRMLYIWLVPRSCDCSTCNIEFSDSRRHHH
jgi:hypothetical protein